MGNTRMILPTVGRGSGSCGSFSCAPHLSPSFEAAPGPGWFWGGVPARDPHCHPLRVWDHSTSSPALAQPGELIGAETGAPKMGSSTLKDDGWQKSLEASFNNPYAVIDPVIDHVPFPFLQDLLDQYSKCIETVATHLKPYKRLFSC